MAEKDLLQEVRARRATLEAEGGVTELFKGLEDLDEERLLAGQSRATQENLEQAKTRVAAAKAASKQMQQSLHDLITGFRQRWENIGAAVEGSKEYQGSEKLYAFFGRIGFKNAQERADRLRRERRDTQTVVEDLAELSRYNTATIRELGINEKSNIEAYRAMCGILVTLNKLREVRVPQYEQVKRELATLKDEIALKQSTIESASPEEETRLRQELDVLQRRQQALEVLGTDLLEKIKVWNQAIPIITQVRHDAKDSIEAFRQARVQLHEIERAFTPILARVMTPIRSIDAIEQFDEIVPTIKRVINEITEFWGEAARAALDRAAAHSNDPIMDPEAQLREAEKMQEALDNFRSVMKGIDEQQKKGPQFPKVSPGGSSAAGDDILGETL